MTPVNALKVMNAMPLCWLLTRSFGIDSCVMVPHGVKNVYM
jgi:hypothetical protein